MKRKILCFLLLFTALLSPATSIANAETEEVTYSSYMDEIAGMVEPRISVDYFPKLEYHHKFLWMNVGKPDVVKWNIESFTYYFTLNDVHVNEFLVGYNYSDLAVNFDFSYISVDEDGKHCNSSATFTYPFSDYYDGIDYMEFVLDYENILSGCSYYSSGYPTIVRGVEVSISSSIMKTHGTCARYVFEYDDNVSKQIYTGVKYYRVAGDDVVLIGTKSGNMQEDEAGDGNGGEIEICHFYSIIPDTVQESINDVNDAINDTMNTVVDLFNLIIFQFPDMVKNVVIFLFDFFSELPGYVSLLLPFLPSQLIYGLFYCIYFCLMLGIVRIVVDLLSKLGKKLIS